MLLSQRAIDAMLWRRDNPDRWLVWYQKYRSQSIVRRSDAPLQLRNHPGWKLCHFYGQSCRGFTS